METYISVAMKAAYMAVIKSATGLGGKDGKAVLGQIVGNYGTSVDTLTVEQFVREAVIQAGNLRRWQVGCHRTPADRSGRRTRGPAHGRPDTTTGA